MIKYTLYIVITLVCIILSYRQGYINGHIDGRLKEFGKRMSK